MRHVTIVTAADCKFLKRKTLPLARAVAALLDRALPRGACWRHVPDPPDPDGGYILIFHRRRAFCLEIVPNWAPLSGLRRDSHARLQDAGIPLEVVRTLPQAKRALRAFGFLLTEAT